MKITQDGGAARPAAKEPARLPAQAPPELLRDLAQPRRRQEYLAPSHKQEKALETSSAVLSAPKNKRLRGFRAPGAPQPKAAVGDAAPPLDEERRVAAWRRQMQARARRVLQRAMPAAASHEAVVKADEISFIGKKPSTHHAAPQKDETKMTPHPPADHFDPWRQPLGGATLSRDQLAILSLGSPEPGAQFPEVESRRPAKSDRAKQGAAPKAPVGTDGPTPPPEIRETGGNQPAIAAPRRFDRPLAEMLHQARQRGEGSGFVFPASPEGTKETQEQGKPAEMPHVPLISSPAGGPRPKRQAEAEEDLDQLAEQMQRILQEQARRHGIDL
ncbi:hypothetical protein [Geoalkalibacter sp.]|uniref:hypothetical protein n=1 Tax=Geoalkalibacter sp. TaxID=3041440 RepID=UPI00272E69BF|nr:hypothetical protein [Geoalkalibacter sp.]